MVKLSPRQVEVLQGVDAGLVWEHYPAQVNPQSKAPWSTMDMGVKATPRYSTVTKSTRLLYVNSLITLSSVASELTGARKWVITDDGRRVLDKFSAGVVS